MFFHREMVLIVHGFLSDISALQVGFTQVQDAYGIHCSRLQGCLKKKLTYLEA